MPVGIPARDAALWQAMLRDRYPQLIAPPSCMGCAERGRLLPERHVRPVVYAAGCLEGLATTLVNVCDAYQA